MKVPPHPGCSERNQFGSGKRSHGHHGSQMIFLGLGFSWHPSSASCGGLQLSPFQFRWQQKNTKQTNKTTLKTTSKHFPRGASSLQFPQSFIINFQAARGGKCKSQSGQGGKTWLPRPSCWLSFSVLPLPLRQDVCGAESEERGAEAGEGCAPGCTKNGSLKDTCWWH